MQRGWGIIQPGKQGIYPLLVPQLREAFPGSEEQKASQNTGAGKAQEPNLWLKFTFTEGSVSHQATTLVKKMSELPGEDKKMPHSCRVRDTSSSYLPNAWKIWGVCQRNQYSRTKQKPLSRFALHLSACGLGAREEGRAGADTEEWCAASHKFPSGSLRAPCLTRIMQHKAQAEAKDKTGTDKQFSFSLSLCSRVSWWGCPNFGGQ